MEFEKIFNFYTVAVIVILLVTTLTCVCFSIISKAESNLGGVMESTALEYCTQNG